MREDLRPFLGQTSLSEIFALAWIDWFVRPRCVASWALTPPSWRPGMSIYQGPNISIGHSFTAINTASQRVQIGVWGREARARAVLRSVMPV